MLVPYPHTTLFPLEVPFKKDVEEKGFIQKSIFRDIKKGCLRHRDPTISTGGCVFNDSGV